MNPAWLGFAVGLLLGANGGVILLALLMAAGRADADAERMGRDPRP